MNAILRDLLLKSFRAWNSKAPTTPHVTAGALLEQSSAGRGWRELLPPERLGSRLRPTFWGHVALLLEEATGEVYAGRFEGVEPGLATVTVTLTPSECSAPIAIRSFSLEPQGSNYVLRVVLDTERGGIDKSEETEADFLRSMEPRR